MSDDAIKYEPCVLAGHEWVGNSVDYREGPDENGADSATHRVRILALEEALKDNEQDTHCCVGCASKMTEAYISFGWDVEVRHRDNTEEN